MTAFISPYILAVIIAWVVAQLAKYLLASGGKGHKRFKRLYMSGGMPSAHSASVAALVTTVGLIDGVDSALFGIALLFGSIVVYDAMMVRRSSGEQGNALQAVMAKIGVTPHKKFFVAHGHTLIEVVAGLVLGVVIGSLVVFWLA